ncbi:DUF7342 family protein [Haladaptatus sp. NG-WS-4]
MKNRVLNVMQRTYDPQPVRTIAERARTSENTARKHLRHLTEDEYVVETAAPETSGALYKRSNESLVLERANRILSEVDSSTLVTRVAEMQETVRSYREEYDADSPADAVVSDAETDRATLQEWQTTRRNLGFAKVALAVSTAEQDLQSTQVP